MGEKIKLTNAALVKLYGGLNGLDGIVPKQGEFIAFNYDSKVSWNISKNQEIAERAFETYNKERKKLIRASGVENQKLTEENAPAISALQEQTEALDEIEIELDGLLMLKRSDLQGKGDKKNGIPPSVWKNIRPILIDDLSDTS